MRTNEEMEHELKRIAYMAERNITAALMGSIADSLLRIAQAQESMFALSAQDLEDHIDQVIKERSEQRAEEIVKEQTGRSFIGRK